MAFIIWTSVSVLTKVRRGYQLISDKLLQPPADNGFQLLLTVAIVTAVTWENWKAPWLITNPLNCRDPLSYHRMEKFLLLQIIFRLAFMQMKKKKSLCCFQMLEKSPQELLWLFNTVVKRDSYISLGKFFSGMHATVTPQSPEPVSIEIRKSSRLWP